MAIRVKGRAGESVEQMLRRFKKMCEKEGLTKDVKRRAYYEKPSERKQRALRKAIKRSELIKLGPIAKKPAPGAKGAPPARGGGGPGGRGPARGPARGGRPSSR
ncbi:MAG: 30S ribosomal protein S21 [Planctomycetota bacterium]|nr:30S ribosomal protein S21 [Planctomycetota bacterium]